ncbi:MAG: cation:proton antiporter [Methylotenera sp.]|nr:cation:proton antiporter [Methylotenera sp.]MDP2101596.1 cation:proton antiporter [Methylotenera sp.]MDP2281715.1 cation:proton antiporter [Methylotenera sp.]MDP3059961.1 cation:proton antiporter [Methylotenera sp.]MDP3206772.1 cation:proton antiporter [Methylotenera sp.]
MHSPFNEFALLLAITAAIGIVAVRFRQPLILVYIIVGIVAGPMVLGWITMHDPLELLAQIGVAVLLFTVGLKLDLHLVRRLGPVALATGLGQLMFTILFGYLLGMALGMNHLKALYVAIALTFSSTIIIIKLLSDKRELDSLHGRIAVGFLIVQDIAVVIAMMAMSTLNMGSGSGVVETLGIIVLKLAAAGLLMALIMRYVLPRLLDLVARSQELMLLFAIAWGIALATLGETLGFSKEVGAFLAGFSLASSPYRDTMSSRLNPVRDFLLLFFFLDLGARLEFHTIDGQIGDAILLSAFVLIGNPLIVMAIMGYMGYRKRTGFMAGLTVAQISEFSIVFVAMGVTLGHVGDDALGLVTLIGLITISVCTYMVLQAHPLYEHIKPWLSWVERKIPFREQVSADTLKIDPEIIIIGMGRYGGQLGQCLHKDGVRVLGVDFDPERVRELRQHGLQMAFGDVENTEIADILPLGEARWVVSTLPDKGLSHTLIASLRQHGYTGSVAVVAHANEDVHGLKQAGATTVFLPYADATEFAAETLYQSLKGKESST